MVQVFLVGPERQLARAEDGTVGEGQHVAGHLYQALIFQGRLLVFGANGIPIANVLIPGRDEGKLLRTTNVE
jgi:hypothetical protein